MLGYNIGSVFGFEFAPASIGGLIIGTQPLLIVVFAALIGREPLTPAAIIGVIVGFGGTAVLFWNDLSISGDNASLLRGGLLIFISGSAWAFYLVIAKRVQKLKGPCEIYQESDMVTRTLRDTFASDVGSN